MGVYALYDLNITANDGSGSNTAIGYSTGRGIVTGVNNTILGASVTGLAAGLSNNIILANGSGAIKAQHDGTNWTLTGAVSMGALTATTGNFAGSGVVIQGSANPWLRLNDGTTVGYFEIASGNLQLTYGGVSALQFSTSRAATFASSVSMGALTATSGVFSGTVQLAGNGLKVNWYSAGYENWYAGMNASATAFVIGSGTTPTILTLGNAGAATFASSVSMGALTADRITLTSATAYIKSNTTEPMFYHSTNDKGSYSGTNRWFVNNAADTTTLLAITNAGAATFAGSVGCGALTATSGTFSGLLTLNYANTGVNSYHKLDRNVITTENMFTWATGGVGKWYLGQRSVGEEGFSLWNANNATQALYFDPTGAATFNASVTAKSMRLTMTYGSELRFTDTSVTGADWSILPQTGNATPLFRIYDRYRSADRFNIDTNGNVGIGTTAPPAYKLDVSGSAGFTGALYMNSGTQTLDRSSNDLRWRYDGANYGILLHTGNVGTNAATFQAAVASATAPLVGTIAQRTAYTPATGTTPYWYATDETASDGKLGTLRQWNGSAWGAEATPQTVVGRVVAGVISAGAVGAQAIAADVALIGQVLRNNGFTAATYTNPTTYAAPSGFKLSGTAFTATYIDGSGSESVFMEIGANVSIGGLKASVIANRVKGNSPIWNTAQTTTWTCPEGITRVELLLIGGGGGGAGGVTNSHGGGGGGAGNTIKRNIVVVPNTVYTIIVGAGGTAGAAGGTAGGSGGSSSMAYSSGPGSGFSTITMGGGLLGDTSGGASGGGSAGGAYNSGTNGATSLYGTTFDNGSYAYGGGGGGLKGLAQLAAGAGGACWDFGGGDAGVTSNSSGPGGGGGGSVFASGGSGGSSGGAGGAGSMGSGGGGGGCSLSGQGAGGAGGAGYVRIVY